MEWSLAWPGRGIAADSSSLLICDLTGDVVAAASLVGPAGTVPTTELGRELTVGVAGTVSSSGVGGAELPQAATAQAATTMIVAARATLTVLNSFMLSPTKLIESTDSRRMTR